MAHDGPGRAETRFRGSMSIVFERPALESKPIGMALRTVMYVGLFALIVAGLSALVSVGAWAVHRLAHDGTIVMGAKEITETQTVADVSMSIAKIALLVSTLYGFASFLWYKLEASRWLGRFATGLLFFLVPAALLAIKNGPALMGEDWTWQVPLWLGHVARWYSFFWYSVIVFLSVAVWRAEEGDVSRPVLPRFAILSVLCYVPYGYVLFVGEQAFLGEWFSDWAMDTQLIVWALFPIQLAGR